MKFVLANQLLTSARQVLIVSPLYTDITLTLTL